MNDILDYVVHGKKLPRKAVAITFDDGFADNADIAAPIMEKYGISGAFYVTTGSIAPSSLPWFLLVRRAFKLTKVRHWMNPSDGNDYQIDDDGIRRKALIAACSCCATIEGSEQQTWIKKLEKDLEIPPYKDGRHFMMDANKIRRLHLNGHIIGAHTVYHPNMAKISKCQMIYEFVESRVALENLIGESLVHFSYPSPILRPHYNEVTVKASQDAGFRTAVTCTEGIVRAGDNPLTLKRMPVPENMYDFRWMIESAFAGLS